jgi:D-alanyl-D-alanine carboxypeptidase
MMQRRSICFILAMLIAIITNAGSAHASRRAILVYDVDAQKVIHHEHGYDKRYPASLTKMMTLYMLFEQLRAGKLKLNTPMTASANAAAQPQTNISLRRGDRITVDQAIRALVVRSANDVALVIAEHIGGSEAQFARMATQKARRLGMNNTQFRNPHGLPNSAQTTTAYDMAILGMSLRRDFPQYYNYFQTKNFSYKGKHFKSHNRVLDALPGVDGIKTGYIRASGFNLVSSLKTRGANLVAVVMGGSSGASRDAEMVKLLKVTQTRLAAKNGGRFDVASTPEPVLKPYGSDNGVRLGMEAIPSTAITVSVDEKYDTSPVYPLPQLKPLKAITMAEQQAAPIIAKTTALSEENIARVDATFDKLSARTREADTANSAVNISFDTGTAEQKSSLDVSIDDIINRSKASNSDTTSLASQNASSTIATPDVMPERNTLDYQLATLNKEFTVPTYIFKENTMSADKNWAVQIGIFKDTLSARRALSQVARSVRDELRNAVADVEYAETGTKGFHRARLKNLSEDSARLVCDKLTAMNQDCFAVKM